MTLRSKLIAACTLVTAVVLLVLAVVTLRYFERQQYETVIQQQQATVSFTAAEVDNTLQMVKDLLMASAKVFPLSAVNSPQGAVSFLQSRTGLHKLFNRNLMLLSPDGALLAESHMLPGHRRTTYGDEQFFRQTLITRKPQVSDPLPCCSRNEEFHILVSAPLLDDQGELRGVMVGAFNLSTDNILSRFAKASTGKNSFIRLISSRNTVIVHSNPRLVLEKVSKGHQQLVQDALNGFTGTRFSVGREGNRLYTSVTCLKSANWVLAASYPQENITQTVRTVRIFFLTAACISLMALVLIIFGYLGHLTAPLKTFTQHLRDLPDKQGQERIFPVTGHDELRQMAESFNQLITSLDRQAEELHLQNVSLEQEMAERQKLQEELHLQNISLEVEMAERQKLQEQLQQEHLELVELNRTLALRIADEVGKNREKDRQMMQQERLVVMGELLSAISHQWRQPLNNVALLIQQLQFEFAEGALTRTTMDTFSHDTLAMLTSLSRTLEEFRTFFQTDRELIDFDPVSRVEVIVDLARPGFASNGIMLDYQGAGETKIVGHCNEFSRVVMTILANARDVLQLRKVSEPKVIVRCSGDNGHAVVTIRDNAGGIPADKLDRIFDPYFTTKFMSQGTGLGLFMCKTIVERVMRGSLTAQNVDKGAEFTIEI